VFSLGIVAVLAIAVLRGVDTLLFRCRPLRRAVQVVDRTMIVAATLYCAWAMALTFNGIFDAAPAVEHRGHVRAVWGIPRTVFWWADVGVPARIERVFVVPRRDHVTPMLLSEGQHVRVWIRPGRLGLRWIERMQLDFEHEIVPLVAAAPSAAMPRKWLIET